MNHTLQQAKNEVARKYTLNGASFASWEDMQMKIETHHGGFERLLKRADEAALLFAKEACEAQRENCLINASLELSDRDGEQQINKDSILNASEPELK